MKNGLRVLSLASVLLLVAAAPSQARDRDWHGHWHHGHVRSHISIGVGPGLWWGSSWWGPPYAPYSPYSPWWYGAPPYYYPYSPYPPQVIIQQPPVYIQKQPAEPAEPSYWYYCESRKAYYPKVKTCPEPWVKVPPTPE